MLRKLGKGKLIYRDQDRNIILAVFQNEARNKSIYGLISITLLQGRYKNSLEISIPEFYRLLDLIKKMPKIEIKKKKK